MVAIIPAAGKGSRMQEVTQGGAKELLALGRKPVLLRILEEARACAPDEIVIVSSREKTAMNEAIDEWSRTSFADTPIRVVFQDVLNGSAPAVALAEVDDEAIIFFGDCVFWPNSPVDRLSNLLYRGMDGCIAVETVSDESASRYGIVEVEELTGRISRIIEKPQPHETSSRWAVAGRIGLSRRMMEFLNVESRPYGQHDQELAIPTVLARAVAEGADIRAVALQSDQERLDCGSPEEYREAVRRPWD
jgi:dTDP-glucose pyrophosphorylase